MSIRAIDELGQTVEYPTATRYEQVAPGGDIQIYEDDDVIAIVPAHWIIQEIPSTPPPTPGVQALA